MADVWGLEFKRVRWSNSESDGWRKKNKAVVRLLLVAEEYRNRGIGTFLLKNTIELAVRDGCDALFYTSTSQSGLGSSYILNQPVCGHVVSESPLKV